MRISDGPTFGNLGDIQILPKYNNGRFSRTTKLPGISRYFMAPIFNVSCMTTVGPSSNPNDQEEMVEHMLWAYVHIHLVMDGGSLLK